VFENRFGFVNALNDMGAHIELLSSSVQFRPCAFCAQARRHIAAIDPQRSRLRGLLAPVPDLRGGFALLIAALAASGESILTNVTHLAKGYERLYEKLLVLGADVQVTEDMPSVLQSSSHLQAAAESANQATLRMSGFLHAEFIILHDKALHAKDRNEKGKTLESLAEYLFSRFPDLEMVSRRVRGATDELDLVYAIHRIDIAQWRILGTLAVIECKNQAHPVEGKQIRDLRAKISNRAISSAIIVTTNSLSKDAMQEIRFARSSSPAIVMPVIEGKHLKMIRKGRPPSVVISECILSSVVK
jgi:hypothetical protein